MFRSFFVGVGAKLANGLEGLYFISGFWQYKPVTLNVSFEKDESRIYFDHRYDVSLGFRGYNFDV
jgi:hypothetical protein